MSVGYALAGGEFSCISCGNCGIVFYVPTHWRDDKVNKHGDFHCPNGHSRRFVGETEEERLKRMLDARDADLKRAREDRDRKDRQLSAARGQVTKIKNRVAAGVCPCCNRTFQNLSRHMSGQHPEWKEQEVG